MDFPYAITGCALSPAKDHTQIKVSVPMVVDKLKCLKNDENCHTLPQQDRTPLERAKILKLLGDCHTASPGPSLVPFSCTILLHYSLVLSSCTILLYYFLVLSSCTTLLYYSFVLFPCTILLYHSLALFFCTVPLYYSLVLFSSSGLDETGT